MNKVTSWAVRLLAALLLAALCIGCLPLLGGQAFAATYRDPQDGDHVHVATQSKVGFAINSATGSPYHLWGGGEPATRFAFNMSNPLTPSDYNPNVAVYCIEMGGRIYDPYYAVTAPEKSTFWNSLSQRAREGILLAAGLGWPANSSAALGAATDDDARAATQALIWEFQKGFRTTLADSPNVSSAIYNNIKGTPAETAYKKILALAREYTSLPGYSLAKLQADSRFTVLYRDGQQTMFCYAHPGQPILQYGTIEIYKTDGKGNALAGAEFTVVDSNNNPVTMLTTTASGKATASKIPYGTYTVVETKFPEGYGLPTDTTEWTVTLNENSPNSTITINAVNSPALGKAKIVKALANPEAGSLAGWSFTVTNASGTIGTYTTNASGEIVLDLEPGTYTVTENIPADSLWECPEGVTQAVTVKAGQTAVVTFTNALRPGEIHIQKVDTNGEPLDGVEFLLEWSEDGTNWSPVTYTDSAVPKIGGCTTAGLTDGRLVTDKNGLVTFSGLYPTLQYRLSETATKDGYQLLTKPAYEGKLSVDKDLKISLKVVNAEIFTLPQTGAKSMMLLPLGILLCLGICAGAIASIRRKEA